MEAFVEKKEKIADRGRRKARAQKEHHVSQTLLIKKCKSKRQRQRTSALRDNSTWRQYRKKMRKSVSGKEDRPPCYSYKEGTL